MPLALAVWPLAGLACLALWFLVALIMEVAAWRAVRLARRRPPPSFGAAPRRSAEAPEATLAFLGDVQRGVADVTRPLARALANRPADLLISSGDLAAHGEAPFYGTLEDAFERAGLDTPLRAVPGDHDLQPRRVRDPRAGYALFEARLGPPSWSVQVGPVLVAGIDNGVIGVTREQLGWLEERLDAHASGPWIAVCHRPPRHVEQETAPLTGGQEDLVELVERRRAALVVCGHDHQYVERRVNGVLYIVNAHGGDVHGLDLGRGPFDLLRVEVSEDGTLRHEITQLHRQPWLRVYLNQFAVRCWASRRKGSGAWLAAPAAALMSVLGLRAPIQAPPMDEVGERS